MDMVALAWVACQPAARQAHSLPFFNLVAQFVGKGRSHEYAPGDSYPNCRNPIHVLRHCSSYMTPGTMHGAGQSIFFPILRDMAISRTP